MLRTPDQVRADFIDRGVSIASWAIANGFSYNLVLETLAGRKKGLRGESHKIAVKLGLKEGLIIDDKNIASCLSQHVA